MLVATVFNVSQSSAIEMTTSDLAALTLRTLAGHQEPQTSPRAPTLLPLPDWVGKQNSSTNAKKNQRIETVCCFILVLCPSVDAVDVKIHLCSKEKSRRCDR